MESVDAIAQKLIPCTCGGYGENNRRHMSDCPRFRVAWEDIAAALRAERSLTETANAAAVNAYAKVRELEALLDGAKSALAAERAKLEKFAGLEHDLDRCPSAVRSMLVGILDQCAKGQWFNATHRLLELQSEVATRLQRGVNGDPTHMSPNRIGVWGYVDTKQAAEAAAEGKP